MFLPIKTITSAKAAKKTAKRRRTPVQVAMAALPFLVFLSIKTSL
jgi:hypothetical protein